MSVARKVCVDCQILKPLESFYQDKKRTDGKMKQCIDCNKASRANYRENNRQKERNRWKKYNASSPEVARKRVKRWRKNNPGKERAKKRTRDAQAINACPPWAKTKEMKERLLAHYLHAEWLEKVTGSSFHVDHIIPLQSDFVCGLHVPENLMVLSAEDNMRKNGYWWPGQLECQQGRGVSQSWWLELKQLIDGGDKVNETF
jgi:hypothetical protein